MDTDELYSTVIINKIKKINNPMDCLLRFRQLVIPVGYVDKTKLKESICKFIDDSGFTHF